MSVRTYSDGGWNAPAPPAPTDSLTARGLEKNLGRKAFSSWRFMVKCNTHFQSGRPYAPMPTSPHRQPHPGSPPEFLLKEKQPVSRLLLQVLYELLSLFTREDVCACPPPPSSPIPPLHSFFAPRYSHYWPYCVLGICFHLTHWLRLNLSRF